MFALQNPQVDIPKGTFLAILISTISYVAVIWILGACCVREATGSLGDVAADYLTNQLTFNTSGSEAMTSTVAAVAQNQYTYESIQNCTIPKVTCKYGLLHDYQVMSADIFTFLFGSMTDPFVVNIISQYQSL